MPKVVQIDRENISIPSGLNSPFYCYALDKREQGGLRHYNMKPVIADISYCPKFAHIILNNNN